MCQKVAKTILYVHRFGLKNFRELYLEIFKGKRVEKRGGGAGKEEDAEGRKKRGRNKKEGGCSALTQFQNTSRASAEDGSMHTDLCCSI
jgi:hypothetical protein